MDDGCCAGGAADFCFCRVLLVGVGGSVDEDSRFGFDGVDVGTVLGRGGGAMGDCCARGEGRVDAPAVVATAAAVARGRFVLLAVAVMVGILEPPA